ncbi:MAG: PAS domain-containing protein, partial [Sphingomonadales bacterium]|nr:PAS domain-containing protein [Sphingomonadales bacterium]
YTNKGKQFSYVVSLGVSIAYEAGFKPPKDVNALTLENHNLIKSINEIYDLKGISAFKKIPKVKDSKTSLAFRLLTDLWEAAYYAGDTQLMTYCALQITTQSLKKGYVSESAFGLVLLATVYVSHGKYSQAHDFGRLAMSLNSKFDDRILLPKVSNLFCNYINFFKEPFSSNLSLYEKSAEVARSNSDYLFGIWAVFFRIWSGILCGEPIRDSLAKLDEYRGFIRQTNDEKMQEACELLRSFLTSFQTTLQNHEGILDANKHPTALLKSWEEEGFKPGLTWYSIIKGQALFLNGDYQGALDVMHKYGRETSLEIVMFPVTQYHYIYALSILMLRGKAKGLDGTWRAKVMHHRSIIENWAKTAPINFNYQLFLIDALLAKADENYWQTHDYFQKAINAANESKSAINIALCNELAADFWLEQGDQTISSGFQRESYSAYSKWGAQRKLFQLENKSKNIKLFKHSRRVHDHGVEGEKNATLSKLSIEDIPYLLKQIQTISIQTEEPLLYQTLLKFLIEQTGAQRALLIKDIDRKSFIVCDAHGLPVKSTSMNPPILFDEYDQISKSLIIDIRKNGGVRLINNATKEKAYKNDPFIKENNIQSILALPIDPNKREAGIIYLENALVQNAFNDNHLKIAQILTSQALISLENVELYSNVLMQIKEREKIENKLRVSEERMRHGIDLGGIGLWELNLETDNIYLPPETKSVFGFRDDDNEATYEKFLGILHPDDREEVDRILTECKTGERKDFVVEYRIITPDGSTRTIEARGGVIKSSHDHVTRIIGVTQNKTKQRLMEEQIGHGKLMSSLEVLTGGIAHDFNNLLGVILGYGQVLKPALQDENQKQYLEHMLEAGNRGAVLTKRLLSLVGSETTEVKEYNINALLEASHDILRKTLTASSPLTYNLQPHKGFVQINQGDFNDVVLNLVVNSKLAMPKGGKMSISTFTTPTNGNIETVNKQLMGEHVAVEFLDSGVGISPDVLPNIFEPFYSTRKEQGGTGLGLSQVYAFVQRSNGGITISSKPSIGTKITLYLPIASKASLKKLPKVNAGESNTLPDINAEKIIIVEDEESLGLLLSTMLKNLGYSTHWVNGPNDALTYLKDNNDIDIMITDLIMPGKLNGADLIQAVQKKYPKIKCQLMSGYIHPDILKTLSAETQKNILSKPFSQLELGKSLANHKNNGKKNGIE